MTPKQWKIIQSALVYAKAVNLFQGSVNSEEIVQLITIVNEECDEGLALAKVYFDLHPKESPVITLQNNPGMDSAAVWESVASTFQNWLDKMKENPHKALAKANWAGKVTKAYMKLKGLPDPKNLTKVRIVQYVEQELIRELVEYEN